MHINPTTALATLQHIPQRFVEVFKHGTLAVEIYQPIGEDHQQPHDRDEVYLIISGTSELVCGENQMTVQAGDFLFVPTAESHRLINFSENFATWVLFYGPKGGEQHD